VGKKKLERFKEMKKFDCVIQPDFHEVYQKDYKLKGQWHSRVFKNNNPIILELGCGKGEYSIGLAEKYPSKNFIGMDIKGARIWRGSKTVIEKGLNNVVFLRMKIELINSFFSSGEVSEIWLTFPDPQMNKAKKRLNSSKFLNKYRLFLKDKGIIHLKTDSELLFNYNQAIIKENGLNCTYFSTDIYSEDYQNKDYSIQTFYEKQYLKNNLLINYQKFHLPTNKLIKEPENFVFP